METEKNRTIKICQIGVGLIGHERIRAILNLAGTGRRIRLSAVYDPFLKGKPKLLQEHNLTAAGSLEEIFSMEPDWVFISTPHDAAVEIAKQALAKGCSVLLEKPLGRNSQEARAIVAKQVRENQLHIGCNYRFYQGIAAALRDMHKKWFGNIVSVNMTMGHGGNPKDKTGWKLDPEKAGGGVLIDPGIHLLDLCQCMFPGGIRVKDVLVWRGFWETGIEEEAHALMQSGQSIINLQLSIVKWRSTFRMEINGDEGYGIIEGRGRSYGKQRYIRGKKWAWLSGRSQRETEEIIVETDGDNVFESEIESLFYGDNQDLIRPCTGKEALASMKVLEDCRKYLT
jgi:predicted dehydrogenase